jgi:ABC-2 type transport system permease protein
MLRGLWNLTWLEIKIFAREPLGLVGSVGIPVVLFVVLGGMLGDRLDAGSARAREYVNVDVPVLAAILISVSAVLSLITVIAIYREGGILKRLRATPLRPTTILTAQVLVKLLFTAITLVLMVLVGRRYYPVDLDVPWLSFGAALLASTVSILSLGFLIASLVPTARFAQPIGTLVLYPMLGMSGLFVPVGDFPRGLQVFARLLPTTHAVSLLKGALAGESWIAHLGDVFGLIIVFAACTALSARVFRWE